MMDDWQKRHQALFDEMVRAICNLSDVQTYIFKEMALNMQTYSAQDCQKFGVTIVQKIAATLGSLTDTLEDAEGVYPESCDHKLFLKVILNKKAKKEADV